MNVREKLLIVQSELNAPKSQYNKFGGYKYRSNEDILNAVKPLLKKVKAVIIQSDEIIQIGERYYVKVTSEFIDIEALGETSKLKIISNTAYAREAENKKGMDEAQITGSASSYARKYSLNGLLAIDDSKDPDTTNKHGKENDKSEKNLSHQDISERPKISKDQVTELYDILQSKNREFKDIAAKVNQKLGTLYFHLDDITIDNYEFIKSQFEKLSIKNATIQKK